MPILDQVLFLKKKILFKFHIRMLFNSMHKLHLLYSKIANAPLTYQ